MLFADKLGMPKKIKDLAESLDLEVTNHHDPEFDAKLCALIFGELTDKYPSYQELIKLMTSLKQIIIISINQVKMF